MMNKETNINFEVKIMLENSVYYDLPSDAPRTPDRTDLCLAWERGINLWAEESYRRMNCDESKVRSYTLPPLPDTKEEWEKQRPGILKAFEECLYGPLPPAPEKVELELLAENDAALNGIALRREYRVHCFHQGRHFDFDMMLYVPKNAMGPVPVFEILNFKGNQSGFDPDIRPTRSADYGPRRWHGDAPSAQPRAVGDDFYTLAVSRGYGVATAAYGEIFPDNLDGFRKSIFRLFYDDLRPDCEVSLEELKEGRKRNMGAISAWAWGLSRMADALETIDLVDSTRLAVAGHSRLGKAALWAGANDTRFKLVISNNSGHGGATLSRRNFGESLTALWMLRSNWFCENMVRYAGLEDELPIDQHQLLALMAPRALYVASSSKDFVADFKGEYLSAFHASKIWHHYGMEGVTSPEMPPENAPTGGMVRYHVKTGPRSMTLYDWEQYCSFADEVFRKGDK